MTLRNIFLCGLGGSPSPTCKKFYFSLNFLCEKL
uniref:Uncharacterized protein n=1 Tax=Setaria italica TaxID=4555 RepID=K3Y482_SETIT